MNRSTEAGHDDLTNMSQIDRANEEIEMIERKIDSETKFIWSPEEVRKYLAGIRSILSDARLNIARPERINPQTIVMMVLGGRSPRESLDMITRIEQRVLRRIHNLGSMTEAFGVDIRRWDQDHMCQVYGLCRDVHQELVGPNFCAMTMGIDDMKRRFLRLRDHLVSEDPELIQHIEFHASRWFPANFPGTGHGGANGTQETSTSANPITSTGHRGSTATQETLVTSNHQRQVNVTQAVLSTSNSANPVTSHGHGGANTARKTTMASKVPGRANATPKFAITSKRTNPDTPRSTKRMLLKLKLTKATLETFPSTINRSSR